MVERSYSVAVEPHRLGELLEAWEKRIAAPNAGEGHFVFFRRWRELLPLIEAAMA